MSSQNTNDKTISNAESCAIWGGIFILLFAFIVYSFSQLSETDKNASHSVWVFIIVALTGGIGGAIVSLVDNNNYLPALRRENSSDSNLIYFGFISEILIGMIAAILVFYSANILLRIQVSESDININKISIIPLSILSGFSGRYIITKMTDKFNSKLFDDVESQKKEVGIHYLFNRALAFLINDKPLSAIDILERCKEENRKFHSTYHLEALCQIKLAEFYFKNETNLDKINGCFENALKCLANGREIISYYEEGDIKDELIFSYRIRKRYVELYQEAFKSDDYYNGKINFKNLDKSKVNEIQGKLSNHIDSYKNSDKAKIYVIEEFGGYYKLLLKGNEDE